MYKIRVAWGVNHNLNYRYISARRISKRKHNWPVVKRYVAWKKDNGMHDCKTIMIVIIIDLIITAVKVA